MAYGHEALERRQRCFVEHLRDQAQILRRHHRLAIAHGNARAFLAAVLQRLQAEARHAGHVLARSEHAEHGAFLFRAIGTRSGQDGRAHATSPAAPSIASAASGSTAPASADPAGAYSSTEQNST